MKNLGILSILVSSLFVSSLSQAMLSESAESADSPLIASQGKYVTAFLAFPVFSILREREKECKDLGQAAFDEFRAEREGDAKQALQALKKVVEAVGQDKGGVLRKPLIEQALVGVGDPTINVIWSQKASHQGEGEEE